MTEYYGCYWYPKIENRIPTIKTIVLHTKTLEEAKDKINSNLPQYPFVRLCNASPKDYTRDGCLYNDYEEVAEALKNSNRTFYMLESDNKHGLHIMMREFAKIDIECRCFYNDKLRAVSCNYYLEEDERHQLEELIIDFFDIYSEHIPYKQCTLDVSVNIEDNYAFVVEFNSFGVNSQANAELFNWSEDYHTLYNSEEPEFKYKKEFEF